MRWIGRWLVRLGLALVLVVLVLLAPVAWVEVACRGTPVPDDYDAILPPEHHRPEARTLLTYPEWHIVHAYDDYARVISRNDPHDYGYLRSIRGFWSSLCALKQAAAAHGGVDTATKQMVYVIGVSFSAELALKAAYEETLGRATTWIRGPEPAPLDRLSARQAADYAAFLQQVPWYKWDFTADAQALSRAATDALRDRERMLALGLEYRAKAAYAQVIEAAVASAGADALTLRMIVTGPIAASDDITVIQARPEGTEIETPRYRALTRLMVQMAARGTDFVEIAGNDDILLTAIGDSPQHPGALHSFARQGYGDYRHLILVKVADLGETLRSLDAAGLSIEHIHDY